MTTILDTANAIGDGIIDSVLSFADAGYLCILAITPFFNPIASFFKKEN